MKSYKKIKNITNKSYKAQTNQSQINLYTLISIYKLQDTPIQNCVYT